MRFLSGRRRIAVLTIVGLVTGLLAPMALAAVTSPTPNQTVSGVFPITEDRGGINNGALGGLIPCGPGAYSRLEIYRMSGIVSVEKIVDERYDTTEPGTGNANPYTYDWNTVGLPNGPYRIRSITSDFGGGLISCGGQAAEVVRSDFKVNVDNGVIGKLDLPSTHFSGEQLSFGVDTLIDGVGTPLPSRHVTVEIDGVGTDDVTTDAAGHGTVTFTCPTCPSAP